MVKTADDFIAIEKLLDMARTAADFPQLLLGSIEDDAQLVNLRGFEELSHIDIMPTLMLSSSKISQRTGMCHDYPRIVHEMCFLATIHPSSLKDL